MAPALSSAAVVGHESGGDALIVMQNLWGGEGGGPSSRPPGDETTAGEGPEGGVGLPEFEVSAEFAEACVMHLTSRESDVAASAAWVLGWAARRLVKGRGGGVAALRVFCAHAEALVGQREVIRALQRAAGEGGVEGEGGDASDRVMVDRSLALLQREGGRGDGGG